MRDMMNQDESTVLLSISKDDSLNMHLTYEALTYFYKDKPDECPTLIIVDELPNDMLYYKCSDIMLLKRGVLLDEDMMEDNYQYRDSIPFMSFKENAYCQSS